MTPSLAQIAAISEMARPLAGAVAGGLVTATAFTLVLIPVLYAALSGNERRDEPGAGSV